MAHQIKIKTGFITLLALIMAYAGCKKDSSTAKTPATVSATVQQTSLQVVHDLVNVIMGGLGDPSYSGLSVNSVGQQHGKLSLNSVTGSGCSFILDTTFNFTVKYDTTTVLAKGPVKFFATCAADGHSVASYTTIGNYVEVFTSPSLSLNYSVNENIVSSGATVADSAITILNGTESVSGIYNYTNGKTGTQAYTYTFHTVKLGTTSGPYSGSADYTAKVSGIFGDWSYSGTVTFLNSSQVKITLGGQTYLVDTVSGEVVLGS